MAANSRKDHKGRKLRQVESQRADHTYMYRWTDRSGKRECIYDDDLNSLRRREQEIQKNLMNGLIFRKVTLNEQIVTYLLIKKSLANSTLENYKYYFEHDIRDSRIGNMLVTDIRKSDILLFYKSRSDAGYKNGTIQILHKIIHPALDLAVDDCLIHKNPADGCLKEYPEDSEEKYALSLQEEKEFLDRLEIRSDLKQYYPFYAIMLRTGLRIGEMIGLTWADVDMKQKTISVNHQLLYRTKNGKTQYYCSSQTKTKSGMRELPMSKEVYDLFRKQRRSLMQIDRDMTFSVDGYSDFVFLSPKTGRALYPANVRRQLNLIVAMNDEREIELPHITPHILRHTACSRYAEAGLDLKIIQYLMGHTDIKTTMKVYNHVDMEREQRAMKVYENWYDDMSETV